METGYILTFSGVLIAAVVAAWTIANSVFARQIEFAEKHEAYYKAKCKAAQAKIMKLREELRRIDKAHDVILQNIKILSQKTESTNARVELLAESMKHESDEFCELDKRLHELGDQLLEHFKE